MHDPIEEISEQIAGLRFDSIPEDAVAAAKRSILDTLAVAWAGVASDTCAEVYQQIAGLGGRSESSVLVFGDRLPAESAAYLNSLFASALDYDGIHDQAIVHADIVVLPAALAIAELKGCSGEEFLTALILGVDLACRLGVSSKKSSGWFYSSVFGVFGAAAASARILGFDKKRVRDALSLAYLQASGTYQAAVERSLAKRHMSALAARAGVFAASLARSGVGGPKQVFQGEYGLFANYEKGDSSRLLDGLGKQFEGANMSLKYYPACFCSHAAIQGTLDLIRDHNIRPEEVEGVEVSFSKYMHRLVGAPFDPSENPQVTAQFSAQYAVAACIIFKRFTLAELTTSIILDPNVRKLAQKVNVIVDPKNDGTVVPADVTITTMKQMKFHRRVESIPGMPNRPLTSDELLAKFESCMAASLIVPTKKQTDLLFERVKNIERLPDMRTLFDGILRQSA